MERVFVTLRDCTYIKTLNTPLHVFIHFAYVSNALLSSSFIHYPIDPSLDLDGLDLNVVLQRMCKRTDLMGQLDCLIEIRTFQARFGNTQLGSELEPLGFGADADQGRDGGIGGEFDLELVSRHAQRAAEASCVPASDQFFGVCSWAACRVALGRERGK